MFNVEERSPQSLTNMSSISENGLIALNSIICSVIEHIYCSEMGSDKFITTGEALFSHFYGQQRCKEGRTKVFSLAHCI